MPERILPGCVRRGWTGWGGAEPGPATATKILAKDFAKSFAENSWGYGTAGTSFR